MKKENTSQLIIRTGNASLSFSHLDIQEVSLPICYVPYTLNNGISMAANLREAFKEEVQGSENYASVSVMVDSAVMMTPIDAFDERQSATLYAHCMPLGDNEAVMHTVLPTLNAVAVFAINKDLKMVVTDRYPQARFFCAAASVWRYMHHHNTAGKKNRLYTYFHNNGVDVFQFAPNRFRFFNHFSLGDAPNDADRAADAIYYLMGAWTQLQLNAEEDELYISGDMPNRQWSIDELHRFLHKVYPINPTAIFNRHTVTRIEGMPLDLMAIWAKA